MTRLALGGYGAALGVVGAGVGAGVGGDDGVGGGGDAGRFRQPAAVAPAENPSWVLASADGRFAYAALERDDGGVGAWEVTDSGPWRPLGEQPTGGAHPCHLALSPDGRWLVVANYTSGSLSVHPVEADGSLGARTDLAQHEGEPGPVVDRQDGPHAHQAVFVDETTLLACDLGLDAVLGYRLDRTSGRLREVSRTAFGPGTGPRHLAVAGGLAYVLGELASTVTPCLLEGSGLSPGEPVSVRPPGAGADNLAAGIVVAGDAVYASNRGDDTVAVLRREEEELRLVETVSCGGSWPRWIGLVGDALLVANERSDAVARLRQPDGRWAMDRVVGWPSPTCCAVLP